MNGKLVKSFENIEVYTFIWNGEPCWVAINVAEMLGYKNTSKTITNCIKRESFACGVDREYEVLSGEDLKDFKGLMEKKLEEQFKYASKIVIFYEKGLYGYLQYTEKPLGVKFRFWIRDEVLPAIRETGEYSIRRKESKVAKKSYKSVGAINNDFDVDKFQRGRYAYETIKLIMKSLDKLPIDEICKVATIKTIFSEFGIELPIYLSEDEDII